jgi:anthranilate synthase
VDPATQEFTTAGGVHVTRITEPLHPDRLDDVCALVDQRRGGVLSSGMEYPGRYSRWHLAYVDPCVEITASGRRIEARALNQRGAVVLPVLATALLRAGTAVPGSPADGPAGHGAAAEPDLPCVVVQIPEPAGLLDEEDRSRRPTVFSGLREVLRAFACADPHLGLYGAFGYDLAFQFEPVTERHQREPGHRDLVLHLPDELYVFDRKRETVQRHRYEFGVGATSTHGLSRQTHPAPAGAAPAGARRPGPPDQPPGPQAGAYARVVELAKAKFRRGELFEVVPSQAFHAPCPSPAAFFQRLRQRNPAPYEFFFNLGAGESLVGASPEMYVRVTGDRVETCPISGTIARGADALEDAANIRVLLNSAKEESELTMCTDVDRNDKSRVCTPGSVKVIGRRQIEMYSRVIHTVDHIEGRLRPGLDALDAFLTHMWAVTVTGAPKARAMQFIEDHEPVPRRWYGGAVGMIGFNGSLNTGLTLRTAHICGGVATVRAGATLLFDSDPAAEERETELKARALLETLAEARGPAGGPALGAGASGEPGPVSGPALRGEGLRVLIVDHQDSFVHTLAGYFREQGALVRTLRAPLAPAALDEYRPDLVVLSPGPGRPSDFGCGRLLSELDARGLPAFGVCLGLQAMVEHAGGELGLLPEPVHGKPSQIMRTEPGGRAAGAVPEGGRGRAGAPVADGMHRSGGLLTGLPAEFTAARYHSLYAVPDQVQGGFLVTAVTAGQVVMAIEDQEAGRWAVQFHPESILTAAGDIGHQIVGNVLRLTRARRAARRVAALTDGEFHDPVGLSVNPTENPSGS